MENLKNQLLAISSIQKELKRGLDLLVAELLVHEEEKAELLDCLSAVQEYLNGIYLFIQNSNISSLSPDSAFICKRQMLWSTLYLGYWVLALEQYVKNTTRYSNEKFMMFEDEAEIFLSELENLKSKLIKVYN